MPKPKKPARPPRPRSALAALRSTFLLRAFLLGAVAVFGAGYALVRHYEKLRALEQRPVPAPSAPAAEVPPAEIPAPELLPPE